MSTNSNDRGRAYEYAWIKALYKALSEYRKIKIINNSSYSVNKRAWQIIDKPMQELLKISANSAVNKILELEPRMIENVTDELILEFQKDEAGIKGDVRDIIIKRDDIQWEIGLSIKHNHEAIKHSRLSYKLDFGNEWYSIPCSQQYWKEVEQIFNILKEEKIKGTKWSEIENKDLIIYIPLLNSFIKEVIRAYKSDEKMPKNMIEYLIGVKDYYKIVSQDSKNTTLIHTFNIHNTLNKSSKIKVSTFSVPIVELPTELVAVKFKKNTTNTVEMYFNNGWQLNFRIHNASTKVEPSLKFDIQFVGMPISILTIECKWYTK